MVLGVEERDKGVPPVRTPPGAGAGSPLPTGGPARTHPLPFCVHAVAGHVRPVGEPGSREGGRLPGHMDGGWGGPSVDGDILGRRRRAWGHRRQRFQGTALWGPLAGERQLRPLLSPGGRALGQVARAGGRAAGGRRLPACTAAPLTRARVHPLGPPAPRSQSTGWMQLPGRGLGSGHAKEMLHLEEERDPSLSPFPSASPFPSSPCPSD